MPNAVPNPTPPSSATENPEKSGPEQSPPGVSRSGQRLELTNSTEPSRLDLFLCANLPGRSRAYIQKLIHGGHVELPGPGPREAKPSCIIPTGSVVKVTFPPVRQLNLEPVDIALHIVYEDEHLAVIDKPPGLAVHPTRNQEERTLVHGLLYHLKDLSGIGGEERPGIVHRLDRDTSGVLLVAKSDRAHQNLSLQFKERSISKIYWAVLRGTPAARQGRLDLAIGRSYYHRKKMMVRTDQGSREAVTEYRILEEFDQYALAEISPRTGRTHQIRVHMAKIRTPVACDQLYGREKRIYLSELAGRPREPREEPIIKRQALHARSIRFHHPVSGTEMRFDVEIHQDMRDLLAALRTHRARKS